MSWSGSGVEFRFEGTEARARLDDSGKYFTVVIDGEVKPVLATAPGERSYDLASGLRPGVHEVALLRRTEPLVGTTRFLGIELGRSGTLLPASPSKRHLEIVGDSLTAGFGNEGDSANCDFSPATENHYLTYGAIAARNLGAELSTIAWSGKGVAFNFGGNSDEPVPELYDRALPEDPTSEWNFRTSEPSAVVINLGTNDFSTDPNPSQAEFGGAYHAFASHIRQKYPNAWIVCLTPTQLAQSEQSIAESYIRDVALGLSSAGDERIVARTLRFTTERWGCENHPSLATHAAMAAALTAELQRLLDW